ncbi:LamG domain-containing protein [Sorangium sp. So ce1151]|uniref:LamG domain-containing protein n=1 Tax=Sorangium sp. So ce1151 TaxID=3133332 RepID=UPI003F638263
MQHPPLSPLRASLALIFAVLVIPFSAAAVISPPGDPDDDVHRWTFDEPSGTVAYDDVGVSNGTLGSSATRRLGTVGTGAVEISPSGIYDMNGYVDFGAAVGAFGTADFTVAHWYQTTFSGTGKHGDIIGNRTAGSKGNYFSVRLVGDGTIVVEICQDSAGTNFLVAVGAPSYGVNDGEWHHLAYVRSGGTFSLYIDGAVVDTRVTGSGNPTNIAGKQSFRIGRRLPNYYGDFHTIPAAYDDLRIYDQALDDDAIFDIATGAL